MGVGVGVGIKIPSFSQEGYEWDYGNSRRIGRASEKKTTDRGCLRKSS